MNKIITVYKIVFLISLNILIFQISSIIYQITILLLLLLPLSNKLTLWKRIKRLIPLFVFIFIFQVIFSSPGDLAISISHAFYIIFRLINITLSVFLFTKFTSVLEIKDLLVFLPSQISLVFILTAYFIPTLFTELEEIKSAQLSRGYHPKKINYLYNLSALIIPLMHRIFQRSDTLTYSIISRGYKE